MNILLVHPAFGFYGGAEIAIVKLVNYLTEKQHAVDILTLQMIPDVREDIKCRDIIFVDSFELMAKKLNEIAPNYNVVNFHNHPVELMLDTPQRSVWFCNEPPDSVLDGKGLDPKEKEKVKTTVTLVLVSDASNLQRFQNVYGIVPKIVAYGTDWSFWSNDEADRHRWDNRSKFTIVHSAVVHRRKGQLETLKAYLELRKTIPHLKLIFAGIVLDQPYFAEIVKFAQENKIKPTEVIITGMLTREELRSLYHSSDVLLHPIGNQGGWLTPLDAIASGLYVIVSEESNIASVLKKLDSGMVTKDYANRVLELYNGESVPFDTVQATVKRLYSWENYAKKVEKELDRVSKCQV